MTRSATQTTLRGWFILTLGVLSAFGWVRVAGGRVSGPAARPPCVADRINVLLTGSTAVLLSGPTGAWSGPLLLVVIMTLCAVVAIAMAAVARPGG